MYAAYENFYVKENAVIVETLTEMHFFEKKQDEEGTYICDVPYKILKKSEIAKWLLTKIRAN